MPKFPSKSISSMNPSVISTRRAWLEKWLQSAMSIPTLVNTLKRFLNIQNDMIEPPLDLQNINEDEFFVKEFTKTIDSYTNSKINIIQNFEKKFFSQRRNISNVFYSSILATLIPLCGDEYTGSKTLDIINKLLTSDHNRDFQIAAKELSKFPVELLQKMKLDESLLKKRFSDSQVQALHILEIIHPSLDPASFRSIVTLNIVKQRRGSPGGL